MLFLYKGFSNCKFLRKALEKSEEAVKTTEKVYNVTDTVISKLHFLYINWNYMTT